MLDQRRVDLTYDAEAESLYVKLLDRPVARTVDVVVTIDVDSDGVPVGIELLDVPQFPDGGE